MSRPKSALAIMVAAMFAVTLAYAFGTRNAATPPAMPPVTTTVVSAMLPDCADNPHDFPCVEVLEGVYRVTDGHTADAIPQPVGTNAGWMINAPACASIDSHNCIWDAGKHGNGTGRSFLDLNAHTYPLTPRRLF